METCNKKWIKNYIKGKGGIVKIYNYFMEKSNRKEYIMEDKKTIIWINWEEMNWNYYVIKNRNVYKKTKERELYVVKKWKR